MKHTERPVVLLLCLWLASLTAVAQDAAMDKQGSEAQGRPQTAQPQQPTGEVDEKQPGVAFYVPPRRGMPLVRVGAGSRGLEDGLPFIATITPKHTGLSSKPQPVLYWYLSADMNARFEFALVTSTSIESIIELVFDSVMAAGLHSLDLADHGVTLQPGVSYRWSVALVSDTEKRSADIVSSGRVEYQRLSSEQQQRIGQASAAAQPGLYAGEGYWYDSFAGLSALLACSPDDDRLLQQLTALLRQIGVDAVANAVAGG